MPAACHLSFPFILPAKNTFFWQLSDPGLIKETFLLGTMHVQDLRAFSNLEFIKEKIDSADAFAAEYHLGDKNMGLAAKLGLPAGVSLNGLIPEKKYFKLRKIILKSTGIDLDYFQNISPFMLTGLIGSQLLGKHMPQSLDEHLWNYARDHNKTMLGIETFEEQIQVLEQIPLDDQVKMLLGLGKNINRFRKHTLHSANLYQQGKFKQLTKSVIKNAGKLRKVLVYQRNEIMADRIHALAQGQRLFATVGAGHLGGGKGVLRLLKRKGVKVSPVFQSDN